MAFGITAWGAYIPRLRLDRSAIAATHAWVAPSLKGLAKGRRAYCAWDEDVVTMAVEACRPGARLVLVGIPSQDTTSFPAGHARRKGLTILLSRRMKEVYPRTIDLVRSGRVDVQFVAWARRTAKGEK